MKVCWHINCISIQLHSNAWVALTIQINVSAQNNPPSLTVVFILCLSSETTEAEEKTNQSSPVDETTAVLTNGGGEFEAATSHGASEQSSQSTTNGPVVASEGVISMKLEPGLSLVVSEAAPGQVPNININEGEEEEGTLVMRAERVIITDEGEDVPEEDQQETTQSEETPLPNLEAGQEGGEAGGRQFYFGTRKLPELERMHEVSASMENLKWKLGLYCLKLWPS